VWTSINDARQHHDDRRHGYQNRIRPSSWRPTVTYVMLKAVGCRLLIPESSVALYIYMGAGGFTINLRHETYPLLHRCQCSSNHFHLHVCLVPPVTQCALSVLDPLGWLLLIDWKLKATRLIFLRRIPRLEGNVKLTMISCTCHLRSLWHEINRVDQLEV
jgi:hypothetical protein